MNEQVFSTDGIGHVLYMRRLWTFCSQFRLRTILMLQALSYALFIVLCLTLWIRPERFFREYTTPGETKVTKDVLNEVRSILFEAHRRAPLVYTKEQIVSTLQTVQDLLEEIHQPKTSLPETRARSLLPEVCPEAVTTPNANKSVVQPIYQSVTCARRPIIDMVTVLLLADSCKQAKYLSERIQFQYPKLPVIVALKQEFPLSANCSFATNIKPILWQSNEAATWIALAREAQTKYILIGRNMMDFTEHTNLDRMLRVINDWSVDFVGGAVRLEPEGRWYAGCYKSALRNFTIRFQPGHDLSVQSCVFCDYIASPFLVRRKFFLKHMRLYRTGQIIPFVDMFLRLVHQNRVTRLGRTVSCLDILFHVAGHKTERGYGLSETPKYSWTELVTRWTVTRLILPGSVKHIWQCSEVGIRCDQYNISGFILPPCCLWELSHCVNSFLYVAEGSEIGTCLTSASILGAVKMYSGFIPWIREFPVGWEARKLTVLDRYTNQKLDRFGLCTLTSGEYLTPFLNNMVACSTHTNLTCVYYMLNSPNWQIRLNGLPLLVCNRREGLRRATSIPLDGRWTYTVFNPGRFVRHQYGDDVLAPFIYSHSAVEKELQMIKRQQSLDSNFDARRFPRHARIDGQFGLSGNIQFQEISV